MRTWRIRCVPATISSCGNGSSEGTARGRSMSRVTDAMRRAGHLADTPDTPTDDHASVFGRYAAEVNPPAAEPTIPAPRFDLPAAPRAELRRPEAPPRPDPVAANKPAAPNARRTNGDVAGGRDSGE